MAVGLIKRYRTCFALTTTLLVLMAGVEFLFYATITVAIASVALGAWMFWKRAAFDRPIPWLPQWGAGRSDDPRMKTPRERAEDMGPREAARGKRETMQKMREGDTSDPRVRLAARMDKDGAAVEVDDDGKE